MKRAFLDLLPRLRRPLTWRCSGARGPDKVLASTLLLSDLYSLERFALRNGLFPRPSLRNKLPAHVSLWPRAWREGRGGRRSGDLASPVTLAPLYHLAQVLPGTLASGLPLPPSRSSTRVRLSCPPELHTAPSPLCNASRITYKHAIQDVTSGRHSIPRT